MDNGIPQNCSNANVNSALDIIMSFRVGIVEKSAPDSSLDTAFHCSNAVPAFSRHSMFCLIISCFHADQPSANDTPNCGSTPVIGDEGRMVGSTVQLSTLYLVLHQFFTEGSMASWLSGPLKRSGSIQALQDLGMRSMISNKTFE